MYYTQVLRVTSGLKWLAIVLAGVVALVVSIAGANGAFNHPPHGSPSDSPIPLPALFAIAGIVAAIFASRYARTLSEENEGHLPVAWTKPVSRERFALTVVGIDGLGIAAAFLLTLAAILVFLVIFQATRFVMITPDTGVQLLRFLALPFAYYGLMMALTASFGKAGRGLIGWTWAASGVLALLTLSNLPHPWKAILLALDTINPLMYASYSYTSGHDTTHIFAGPNGPLNQLIDIGGDFGALALIAIFGLAAGVLLWRRVEA